MALIVAYSFWETVNYNVVHHWTFSNYSYFFSTSTYVKTLFDTVWVAAVATFLTLAGRVPTGVLARALRASGDPPAAAADDHPAVLDELPAAGHELDDDPR